MASNNEPSDCLAPCHCTPSVRIAKGKEKESLLEKEKKKESLLEKERRRALCVSYLSEVEASSRPHRESFSSENLSINTNHTIIYTDDSLPDSDAYSSQLLPYNVDELTSHHEYNVDELTSLPGPRLYETSTYETQTNEDLDSCDQSSKTPFLPVDEDSAPHQQIPTTSLEGIKNSTSITDSFTGNVKLFIEALY